MIKPGKEVVLAISDTQCPFEHKDTGAFLTWVKEKFKPTKIVAIGDEADYHALSRFVHDPDGYSAGDELKYTVKHLQPIYKLFPKVMCCTSNHVDRPYDRAYEAGIPRSMMKDIREILKAPKGWQWADTWVIDGISYVHGHHLPGGKHCIQRAATEYPTSVVFGHVHAHAGIYYKATKKDLRFAMNIGCLIDNEAYAFVYGKKFIDKPIVGCGIITKGLPQFVPMLLNTKGRWVGK